MPSMCTVFLVDDDASVRKGLMRLIESAGYQVQAFASARELLNALPQERTPACLVLDVRMPGLTGLDLQAELRNTGAILPIIFITGYGDIPTSVRAMKGGAVNFLSKPVQDHDLLEAVEEALSRAAREEVERAKLEEIQRCLETLTPREREVLQHVVSGRPNKQIAFDLGTAEKTIKVHRARVMQKMQAASLAELVSLAQRAGINYVNPYQGPDQRLRTETTQD